MDFLFDIQQLRRRIHESLCQLGRAQEAEYLHAALITACPTLIATGSGREAVVYRMDGYAIVVTDRTGCRIPLKDDWLIGVYAGELSNLSEEILLLECDH